MSKPAKHTVRGVSLPRPRLTRWALAYGLLLVGGPVLAILIALDALIWAVARWGFGVCYGVWC